MIKQFPETVKTDWTRLCNGVPAASGPPADGGGVRDRAARPKRRCGTGGAVRGGRIERQGEQRERIAAELEKPGCEVRR
jgi:translation initiation factor 1 (eIF-1/SUI1)